MVQGTSGNKHHSESIRRAVSSNGNVNLLSIRFAEWRDGAFNPRQNSRVRTLKLSASRTRRNRNGHGNSFGRILEGVAYNHISLLRHSPRRNTSFSIE